MMRPSWVGEIRAVTFDCYGTLIDWEKGILRAVRPLLSVRGVRVEDAAIIAAYATLEAEAERGEYLAYREVLANVSAGLAERFGVTLEDRELDRLAGSVERWEPFADTPGSLDRLGERFRLAICSNIDDDLFEATGERLGAGRFERVVTAEYCRSYKPDPRHFRVVLALLDLRPHEVLHAAQSRYHDIVPASALGMRTAWVNRTSVNPGRGATPEAGDAQPDLAVADLAELARLIA